MGKVVKGGVMIPESIWKFDQLLKISQDIEGTGRRYVFRGKPYKKLETSLDRVAAIGEERKEDFEVGVLREFKRRYHHYSAWVPQSNQDLTWCSIMRHHGAPSRLLDFTYSIWIAAYFAVEEGKKDAFIWAIDAEWAHEAAFGKIGHRLLKDDLRPERDEEVFEEWRRKAKKAVCFLNPHHLNERLSVQQGVFGVPGDTSCTFQENLDSMLTQRGKPYQRHKILVPKSCRGEILRGLHRMGISHASLFPGLDGYAKSLDVTWPHIWNEIQ